MQADGKRVPMDRLLCGDVELQQQDRGRHCARRDEVRANPTGGERPSSCRAVLAQQGRYQTAVQRFLRLPVEIRMLSRFCTQSQVRQTFADMRTGKCDLVIGTF